MAFSSSSQAQSSPQSRRGKSQRQLRVGEEIRHIIADILLRESFHEPALDGGGNGAGGGVTIAEVTVSPDFANANVYVIPFIGGSSGDDESSAAVMAALERIAPQIRNHMAKRLTTRRAPRLKFIADTTAEKAARLDALMDANKAR